MSGRFTVGACVSLAIVVAIALVARHRRRGGRISPWWAIGPWWVFLSVIYLTTVFDKQTNADYDLSCPLPGQDSQFGYSTWQSWPPGPVCHQADGSVFSRPGLQRASGIVIAAGGSIVFLAAGTAAVQRRLGRQRPPSDDVRADVAGMAP